MHTMYVDKPMKGPGLMQAIAHVNRVFKDKPAGLVVDYIGVGQNLKSALGQYSGSDRDQTGIDKAEAVRVLMEQYEVVRAMDRPETAGGFDDRPALAPGAAAQMRLATMAGAIDWVLTMQQNDAAKETTDEAKKRAHRRYAGAVLAVSKAFALASASDEASRIREEVGFFQAIRAALVKSVPGDGKRSTADRELTIQQIVSRALVSTEIVDIMEAAGLESPDISILSDKFLAEVREMEKRNLAVEALKKLIAGTVRAQSQRNVTQAKGFTERLEAAIARYHTNAITIAQVLEELIQIAKDIRAARARGEEAGLSEEEIAFCDALAKNESARQLMGEPGRRMTYSNAIMDEGFDPNPDSVGMCHRDIVRYRRVQDPGPHPSTNIGFPPGRHAWLCGLARWCGSSHRPARISLLPRPRARRRSISAGIDQVGGATCRLPRLRLPRLFGGLCDGTDNAGSGAHGDEFLGGGGVDADGLVEIGFGGAGVDGDGEALDDLGGVFAKHVGAEDFLGGLVDDEFHDGFAGAFGQGVAHRGEFFEVDVGGSAGGGFGFGEADGSDGGGREHGAGHAVEVPVAGAGAVQAVGQSVSLSDGDRGEVDAVGNVADGVDVGLAGGVGFVNRDCAMAADFDAGGVEPEIGGVGRAAEGGKDHAGFNDIAVVERDAAAGAVGHDTGNGAAGVQGNALGDHGFGQAGAHVVVEAAQRQWGAVDQFDLGAETLEQAGKLDGDVATADDGDVAGQAWHVEDLVGDHGQSGAEELRCAGSAADGDDDALRGDALAPDLNRVRVDEAGAGLEGGAVGHQALVDAVEAGNLGVLGGDQLGPVVGSGLCVPAEAVAVDDGVAVFAGHDHELLGHAANIDAGAAPGTLLGDSYLGTVAGGHAGAADAAGAAADDEEVEVVGHLLGSFRKARALPWTCWGRRPQTPIILPKSAYHK